MCDSVKNITQLASPHRRQRCATPLLHSITPVDKSLPNIQFRIMTFHEFPTAIPYEPVVVVVTALGNVYRFFPLSLLAATTTQVLLSPLTLVYDRLSRRFLCTKSKRCFLFGVFLFFFFWYETYWPLGRFDFSTPPLVLCSVATFWCRFQSSFSHSPRRRYWANNVYPLCCPVYSSLSF